MSEEWDNVILLSADALRADHLSSYGYHRETSPELDALAEESIRFTNAYSASSHTREAVPALLTGEYPDVAVDDGYHLATESIAETLSAEGFSTAGFHSNPFCSRAYGFDRGFDHFDDDLHLGQHKLIALAQRALDKLRNRHYARAEEINERSLAWLDSLDDGEPFFLWNHYMDTHGPYEPPGDYATVYAEQGLSGRDAQSLYQRAIDDPESITEAERQLLVDLYDGEIRYNDKWIGAFLDALRERELLEKSLLIVTADHGDAFGEHGYYEHPRYLHEELVEVPMMVRPPGGCNGKTRSVPVSTTNVAGAVTGEQPMERLPGDRTVFQMARGEGDDIGTWRYAARSRDGQCFCEDDGDVHIGECDDGVRDELIAFVDSRGGSAIASSEEVDEEIERRLDALGYK